MKQPLAFLQFPAKILIFAMLGWIAFQPDGALAKIYKYKDDQGRTHFTDDASKIPLRYRQKDSVEKFKGVIEPAPAAKSPAGSSSRNGAGAAKESAGEKADEGFSEEDKALAEKSIMVLKTGVALANRYKDAQPNSSNGRGMVIAIQSALPQKESLANELGGTKVPVLQEILGFLRKSIAVDRETKSIGAGLKTRIVAIFNRVAGEGETQSDLIRKIEQALEESKKKKEEAQKNKTEIGEKGGAPGKMDKKNPFQ